MKIPLLLFLFICCIATCCFSQNFLTEKDREELSPYLLPDDHPAKPYLDEIFFKPHILPSKYTLAQSEFKLVGIGCTLMAIKHPQLNGYILKTFIKKGKTRPCEWQHFLTRIKGAQIIQDSISKLHFENIMKVPKKWIYKLPHENDDGISTFILVAEDMKILEIERCKYFYKHSIKKPFLKAIFILITTCGLTDSCQIVNIPICEDGKIAFVDTERFNERTIKYRKIHPSLSKDNLKFWKSLVKNKQ